MLVCFGVDLFRCLTFGWGCFNCALVVCYALDFVDFVLSDLEICFVWLVGVWFGFGI